MAAEKQGEERAKVVFLTDAMLKRVDEYAEKNNLTRSGAIADVVKAVAEGMPLPVERKRVGRRIGFWIANPETWLQFKKQAKRLGVTQGEAIMAAIEELT